MKKEGKAPEKRKVTSRQIVALTGVILLVLLYFITLVTAITDNSASADWFRICLAATVALPLLIWIYTWLYSRLTNKPAIGDPNTTDINQDNANAGESSQNTESSSRS